MLVDKDLAEFNAATNVLPNSNIVINVNFMLVFFSRMI